MMFVRFDIGGMCRRKTQDSGHKNSPSALTSNVLSLTSGHILRGGYVFLITVLIIGAISIAVASSMLLLATTAARTALVHQQSTQALAYADTCAERALRELRSDGSYAGSETVTFGDDNCRILSITGSGNENRGVCTEGKSGSVTRRLEIVIDEIIPLVIINSWKEVGNFSLCSS